MDRNNKIIFEAVLSILILIGLLILVLESIGFLVGIKDSSIHSYGYLDLIMSILILIDFVLYKIIKRKNQTLVDVIKKNWFYIIAGIPLFFICFNIFQLYYFTLIIGLIGIIRIYALVKVLIITSWEVRRYPQKTKLDYATVILFLVLIIGSTLFLLVEKGVNPEVTNFESAIWYALVSMTTTGYGDIVPVTLIGQLIGIIFILTGMAYVSLATATLAYSFIDLFRKESQKAQEKSNVRFQETSEDLKDSLKTHDEKIEKVLQRMDEIEKKMDEKER
ncbi:MAG: potassium channel family protein [Methanobacterium sp.]|nr:potassium channel family protein [Methanobacterium sp.]